jgi:hypothetical protein
MDPKFHEGAEEGAALTRALLTNCTYLERASVEIEGVKFYGAPEQPCLNDMAFNRERGAELKEEWDKIPADTQVLVTHGRSRALLHPPFDAYPRPASRGGRPHILRVACGLRRAVEGRRAR